MPVTHLCVDNRLIHGQDPGVLVSFNVDRPPVGVA